MTVTPETTQLSSEEVQRFIAAGASDDARALQLIAQRWGEMFMRQVVALQAKKQISFQEACTSFVLQLYGVAATQQNLARGIELAADKASEE